MFQVDQIELNLHYRLAEKTMLKQLREKQFIDAIQKKEVQSMWEGIAIISRLYKQIVHLYIHNWLTQIYVVVHK